MLILRELFAGNNRFDGLLKRVGASTNILSNRLKRLLEQGVLIKVPYQEKPTRYRYELTEAGFGLFPVMLSMTVWGNSFSEYGQTIDIIHKPCGPAVPKGLNCSECGELLTYENTRFGIAKLVQMQKE